jgi:Tfp pilus assembly protein PilV
MRSGRPGPRFRLNQRGVGLMEIIVATVIATVAVLGLAYTIGTGRGLINRYEVGRAGLAEAQRRMEQLIVLKPTAPELQIPSGSSITYADPFVVNTTTVGTSAYTVAWFHDPSSTVSNSTDLKRVTVRVSWTAGPADSDAVTLERYFPIN